MSIVIGWALANYYLHFMSVISVDLRNLTSYICKSNTHRVCTVHIIKTAYSVTLI